MPTIAADVTDIVVEYQRVRNFWLPRSQVMEGFAKSTFAMVPVVMENRFQFESVNETARLAVITVDTMSTRTRTVDSVKVSSLDQCKTSDTRVVTAYKGDSVPISMRVPCDLDKLLASPDLPKSAFDDAEEIFGTSQRAELVAQALTLSDQAPFDLNLLLRPEFEYGVSFTRYNRIEGLSTAIVATQQLGAGLDLRGLARIGTADRRPRLELSIGRSNASKTIRLGAYNRLLATSDWESPLSFGSSISAFFFGRDEAFYYRTTGGELQWTSDRGIRLDWRAFVENQNTATQKTSYSVAGSFMPNIVSEEGVYSGASVRYQRSRGLDPRGFRASTDVRLEAARGDSLYGRGSLELTFLRGFRAAFDGALTVAGGTSVGHIPVQRLWYLGGTQTIRGIGASSAYSGNAFWFSRAEVARPLSFMRLAAFGDIGWAGARERLREVGRPLSGAGLGFSFLDGTLRLDVARGIYPTKDYRVSFYLGSRF